MRLVPPLAVLLTGGCANHEGTAEYRPRATESAPSESVENTIRPTPLRPTITATPPRETNSGKGTAARPSAKPKLPHPSATQVALDAYTVKLQPILQAGGAERTFQAEMKRVASKLDQEGLAALVPIYTEYAEATRKAADQLADLKPPAVAAGVHRAWIEDYRTIAGNLEASVQAMRANDGAKAAHLSQERPAIIRRRVAAVERAVQDGGFDLATFNRTGRLVLLP